MISDFHNPQLQAAGLQDLCECGKTPSPEIYQQGAGCELEWVQASKLKCAGRNQTHHYTTRMPGKLQIGQGGPSKKVLLVAGLLPADHDGSISADFVQADRPVHVLCAASYINCYITTTTDTLTRGQLNCTRQTESACPKGCRKNSHSMGPVLTLPAPDARMASAEGLWTSASCFRRGLGY